MIELKNLESKLLKPLKTPLIRIYDSKNNNVLYLKDETRQYTGAFKYRGVYNKILHTDLESYNGVITASTGNHGQAVANICNQLQLGSYIVVPFTTPQNKLEKIRSYNANIISNENLKDYNQCVRFAKNYSKKNNLLYIPSFDDELIIRGHQSIFDEIASEGVNIDIAFCQIGGGGLISAMTTHDSFKNVYVCGVELENADSMRVSLRANKIKTLIINQSCKSFCEGVLVSRVGELPFNILKTKDINIDVVTEDDVKLAIKFLHKYNIMAEGAGAVGVAKYLKSNIKNKSILCVISGGNIDKDIWEEIINETRLNRWG